MGVLGRCMDVLARRHPRSQELHLLADIKVAGDRVGRRRGMYRPLGLTRAVRVPSVALTAVADHNLIALPRDSVRPLSDTSATIGAVSNCVCSCPALARSALLDLVLSGRPMSAVRDAQPVSQRRATASRCQHPHAARESRQPLRARPRTPRAPPRARGRAAKRERRTPLTQAALREPASSGGCSTKRRSPHQYRRVRALLPAAVFALRSRPRVQASEQGRRQRRSTRAPLLVLVRFGTQRVS